MTAIPTIATPIASAPLRPRPDIGELWTSHAKPIAFETAANLVLDAHADDGDPDDIVATDLRTWAFGSNDGRTMQLVPIALPGRPQSGPVALRDLAFNQLAARIGAPPSYIRELPEKLQVANINYGMTHERRSALLRLAGNELRAVVSEKYVALDDELLLDVAADVLDRAGYLTDAVVRVTAVGLSTVLRMTLPGEGVAVRAGDVIEYGLDIGNSEVGLRSVQVTPITYRLVCTNGMRAWRSEAAMRMRHVGDPKRLQDALRDAVPVAFAEARGDIAKWRRAVDVLIDSALDEVESLRAYGLSNGELTAVGRAVAALPVEATAETVTDALKTTRTTAYDVANAITATAQDRGVEARLGMEEVGHRYLSRRAA